VSGGIFSGGFSAELPFLTFQGVQEGYRLLGDDERAVLDTKFGAIAMCVFAEKELPAFVAAGFAPASTTTTEEEDGQGVRGGGGGGGGGGATAAGEGSGQQQEVGGSSYTILSRARSLAEEEEHAHVLSRVVPFRGYEATDGFRGTFHEAVVRR
jgi:hypothetical protein